MALNLGAGPTFPPIPIKYVWLFLDYYAFEANKEEARNSLRVLSEKQLPQFIYEAVREQPQPPLKLQPELQRVQAGSPFQTRPLRGGHSDWLFHGRSSTGGGAGAIAAHFAVS